MSKKEVWYVAHPVRGNPHANAYAAIAWIRWLFENDTRRVYIAPWVAEVLAFENIDTGDADFIDRVLSDDEEIVRHCDGLLLVGGRISSGMEREMKAAIAANKTVVDWTCYVTSADVPASRLP